MNKKDLKTITRKIIGGGIIKHIDCGPHSRIFPKDVVNDHCISKDSQASKKIAEEETKSEDVDGELYFPLDALVVYSTDKNKIRLGRNRDGGYVIIDGFSYDVLLSGGIADDISFENGFLNKYDVKCYAFDGSIRDLPENANQSILFIKKNIGHSIINVDLSEYIDRYNSIFLKLDIEGGEYPFIESLSASQIKKIKQITIEFHNPFEKRRYECIQKLNQTHYLLHIHANNFSGTVDIKDQKVPKVFECTYLLKELVDMLSLNSEPIPSLLDMPNDWRKPDIQLSGYPYTHQNSAKF